MYLTLGLWRVGVSRAGGSGLGELFDIERRFHSDKRPLPRLRMFRDTELRIGGAERVDAGSIW